MTDQAPATTKTKTPAKHKISHRRGHGRMKNNVCIQLKTMNGVIQRKDRKVADAMVASGGAFYVSRSKWREQQGTISENAREAVKPAAKAPKASKKK